MIASQGIRTVTADEMSVNAATGWEGRILTE
jgi:hypothetical protein